MRLPVPGTGRSTHPANWERRGSPGGGAGQERKNAPLPQHREQLSSPPPPRTVPTWSSARCLPRPPSWAQPPAQGHSCLRSAHAGSPELLPWPPGPSQRLCCSRPPAGMQSRGTPAVRLPAQGLCEMREIVSPGRRPPAPAALPSLCLRFPVDVLLQGSALPPCPGSPPAVPASPRPGPQQLGSGPWLDRQCPPGCLGSSPRLCSRLSPGPLLGLIAGARAGVLAPPLPQGHGRSPQGPQGGVPTTSHLPDPGSDAPMGGSRQDSGRGGRSRVGTRSGKRTSTRPHWTPGPGTVSPLYRWTVEVHVGNRQLSPNQKGREKGPLSRPLHDPLRTHALCQAGFGLRGSAVRVRTVFWGRRHTRLSALSAWLSKREAASAGDLGSSRV